MVLRCTGRMIKEQLIKKGFSISLGTVLSLKPFFVTYPTEKEISLCLCKLCLNVKLLFEPLATKAKRDGSEISQSTTEFFMFSCKCPKSLNGYYQLKCVTGKCKECSKETMPLDFQNYNVKTIKVSQFVKTTTEYTTKENKKKTSNKVERV